MLKNYSNKTELLTKLFDNYIKYYKQLAETWQSGRFQQYLDK